MKARAARSAPAAKSARTTKSARAGSRHGAPARAEAHGATFTIADLAREFDITPRAIRFYEDQGILAPARAGSGGLRRIYSARDRTRLKLTLRGKRLGLSLLQIRELIDMYESPKDAAAQARRFLKVLQQHRAALEQQREDIEVTLAEIAQHEARCRKLLAQAPVRPKRG
jgi:DNA-binding transcriptional MerR regulator